MSTLTARPHCKASNAHLSDRPAAVSGEQQAPPKAADDHEPSDSLLAGVISFEERLRPGRGAGGKSPALQAQKSQRRVSTVAAGAEVRRRFARPPAKRSPSEPVRVVLTLNEILVCDRDNLPLRSQNVGQLHRGVSKGSRRASAAQHKDEDPEAAMQRQALIARMQQVCRMPCALSRRFASLHHESALKGRCATRSLSFAIV